MKFCDRTLLVRLRLDHRGVAMIELAICMPVLLLIGLGGVEVANLAVTVQRVNQLAMMAADNGGRVRTTMDELDVNEIMIGVEFAGREIKFAQQGRLILSSVVPNKQPAPKTGYTINWQRCFGTKNAASSYGSQGYGADSAVMKDGISNGTTKVVPVAGSALMMAEIRYTYQPILPMMMAARELSATQVFPVRERTNQTLSNTSLQTDSQRRLCDANHLSAT